MILNYALLAVLLQSVVIAAAATTPAARQLASTVGSRNDPEVETVHRFLNSAVRLTVRECRT
jgi:hypothetical protein